MKFYIDITLLPSSDVSLYFLWKKVYQQIHLTLAMHQNSNGKVGIGVAFPEYDKKRHQLGRKLRLFSLLQKNLEIINLKECLSRLRDYVHITNIRNIPENISKHAIYKRIQTKSSNLRLARRKAKRENIRYEEALAILSNREEVNSKYPYIQMNSYSSDKSYRLIIGYEETDTMIDCKEFSTYGLSSKCSVPIF